MVAVLGFMMGIFVATIYHFSHDHTGLSPEELVRHFIPRLLGVVTGCTTLSVLAATAHNRLKRK
jgi:hypothetical protein